MTTITELWNIQKSFNIVQREISQNAGTYPEIASMKLASNTFSRKRMRPQQVPLMPAQAGHARDYDAMIAANEYRIERENVIEQQNSLDQRPTAYFGFKLDPETKNALIKNINALIREQQQVFVGQTDASKLTHIFKLFNDLSFLYNETLLKIVKDIEFKRIFHARIIQMEQLFIKIRTRFEDWSKNTIYKYNSFSPNESYKEDYIIKILDNLIYVSKMMLEDKNTTQYLSSEDTNMEFVNQSQVEAQPLRQENTSTDDDGDDEYAEDFFEASELLREASVKEIPPEIKELREDSKDVLEQKLYDMIFNDMSIEQVDQYGLLGEADKYSYLYRHLFGKIGSTAYETLLELAKGNERRILSTRTALLTAITFLFLETGITPTWSPSEGAEESKTGDLAVDGEDGGPGPSATTGSMHRAAEEAHDAGPTPARDAEAAAEAADKMAGEASSSWSSVLSRAKGLLPWSSRKPSAPEPKTPEPTTIKTPESKGKKLSERKKRNKEAAHSSGQAAPTTPAGAPVAAPPSASKSPSTSTTPSASTGFFMKETEDYNALARIAYNKMDGYYDAVADLVNRILVKARMTTIDKSFYYDSVIAKDNYLKSAFKARVKKTAKVVPLINAREMKTLFEKNKDKTTSRSKADEERIIDLLNEEYVDQFT